MFHYIQLLHYHQTKGDKVRRVWDPTYTMVYQDSSTSEGRGWSLAYVSHHIGSERLPKSELVQYLQKKAQVIGPPSSPAASRLNLASAPIVGFLVEYAYYDHQYEGKVYWTSVSIEQF